MRSPLPLRSPTSLLLKITRMKHSFTQSRFLSGFHPQALTAALFIAFVFSARCAETQHNFAKWEKEISSYEQLDRTNPPPQRAVLFIGSSTIRLWKSLPQDFPKQNVINRGFGGSEIVDSTHFAERIIFPYKPRKILLRAGGNDWQRHLRRQITTAGFCRFSGICFQSSLEIAKNRNSIHRSQPKHLPLAAGRQRENFESNGAGIREASSAREIHRDF